jgi:hypothetical protein
VSKLSERQRLVLTVAVAALLAGGLVTLIYMDRKEIDEFEAQIATLDDKIRASDVEIARTKEREDKVLVFRAVESRELAVLPTRQMISGFHNNLSLFLASSGVRFIDLPESTPVESDLAKGIYVTRQTLSGTGDAASILKLVNMLENDPRLVAVKGLTITAGEKDEDAGSGSAAHEVQLTLETYFYNPEAATAHPALAIPGAERRLEEPGVKEAIASFVPESPDTYSLRPASSRRDPFVDPRRVNVQEDPEALKKAFEEQEPIVIDIENRIRDVGEKVEQVKQLVRDSDLFRKDRLQAEIDADLNEIATRILQMDQMKTITVPALQQKVLAVRSRLDGLRSERSPRELVVTRAIAETTLADIREAMEKGLLEDVTKMVTQWEQFLRGKQVELEATAVVEQIAAFRHKAKTIAEFHQKNVRVTGTIVDRTDERRSVALVNGRTLHRGDKFDEKGEILIGAISASGVDFLYGGEVIHVARRSGVDPDEKKVARGKS